MPIAVLILTNILFWLVVQLGAAALGTRLAPTRFNPRSAWFRERLWERGGRLYERVFRVRVWKDLLPDGAAWFRGGFPKATLRQTDPAYVERFIRETCRGEAVHWVVMLCGPLSLFWNPPWAGGIMMAYGIAGNLPCILIQRYNRLRLRRVRIRKRFPARNPGLSKSPSRRCPTAVAVPRRPAAHPPCGTFGPAAPGTTRAGFACSALRWVRST